mgnify:CR=1 FL=1
MIRLGYWLGSADVKGGGIALYAWRILELIIPHVKANKVNLVIIATSENKSSCYHLLDKYGVNAEIKILPNLNIFYKIVTKFFDFLLESFEELNISIKWLKKIHPWSYWYESLKIDLLHVPYQTFSSYCTSYRYSLSYPFVVTMHDLQELHYPHFFTPYQRAFRAKYFWKNIEYSSGIVVSFSHVKNDIMKYFKIPNHKIDICPLPFKSISLTAPCSTEQKKYDQKYNSEQGFLLYPAQTWEHKNHLSLIKSLEIILKKYNKSIKLICTGRKNSDFFPKVNSYLINSCVSNQVYFSDIIPEEELYWLYKNCTLVVIPTLYEAGSFPLLEAMFLGVPVICSSVTSLPETIKDKRFIFDPLDIEGIADLIYKMITNQQLRQDSIINGKTRIKELRDIDSFEYYLNLWKKVLKKM